MGRGPHLLPLWTAHEVPRAVRSRSPTSRADLKRLVTDLRGYYDYWDTGSRAPLRELLANEGAAVAAAQAVAPGFEPWEYFGYTRRQYRRIRERSEEHTSELQSQSNLVCRLLLEKKKNNRRNVKRLSPRTHLHT